MDTAALFPFVLAMLGTLAANHAPAEPSRFDIQLHLRIDPSIARMVRVAELRHEVEQIWQPYGVRITWSDSPTQFESFALTALLGRDIEQRRAAFAPLVLGRAVIGPSDPPTRPIRFSLMAIEETLALRPHAWTSIAGRVHQQEVARALGRVLAHEIGHVLLALHTHEQTGLMRAIFTPEQLGDVDRAPFALTANSEARLTNRIERLRIRTS